MAAKESGRFEFWLELLINGEWVQVCMDMHKLTVIDPNRALRHPRDYQLIKTKVSLLTEQLNSQLERVGLDAKS